MRTTTCGTSVVLTADPIATTAAGISPKRHKRNSERVKSHMWHGQNMVII